MAIDPKLVSIKKVTDIPTVPLSELQTGQMFGYTGDGDLKKVATNDLLGFIKSGIKGTATQSNAPTPYDAVTYPDGLFETYVVRTPLTMPNSWGLAVTQLELDNNFVYFDVKNGVVSKELSLKPILIPNGKVELGDNRPVSGNTIYENYNLEYSGNINLFDKDDLIDGFTIDSAGSVIALVGSKITQPIKLKSKTKVSVFNGNTANNHRLIFLNENKNLIGSVNTFKSTLSEVAVPIGAEYIQCWVINPDDPADIYSNIYITETNDILINSKPNRVEKMGGKKLGVNVDYIIGNNIFDGLIITDFYLTSGGKTVYLINTAVTEPIELIKRNGLLSVKIGGTLVRRLVYLDENFNKDYSNIVSFTGSATGLTVPATAKYVQIYCKTASENFDLVNEMMVSETETLLPFEPYKKNLISVEGAKINIPNESKKITIANKNKFFNLIDSDSNGIADNVTIAAGITETSVSNGIQFFKGGTPTNYVSLDVKIKGTHIYYIYAEIANVSTLGNGVVVGNVLSGNYVALYSYPTDRPALLFSAEKSTDFASFGKVSVIDLTEIYGAGNEPTLEQFTYLLSKNNNGKTYVESEIIIEATELELTKIEYENKYSLEIKSIPYNTNNPASKGIFPVMNGVKLNNEKSGTPYPVGWLFYVPDANNDILYSEGTPNNPKKIFSWNKAITPGGILTPQSYSAIICKNGDIIFVFRTETSATIIRSNPIIYKASDNYASPQIIDFGTEFKPAGWLGSSGMTMDFRDNVIYIAEYVRPYSVSANVWKVVAPFDNPANWSRIMTKTIGTDVEHFHTAQIDPFTQDLYITSGDANAQCRWWRSVDKGVTFAEIGGGDTRFRVLNFIFTKDYAYYGTDSGGHFLMRIGRGVDGKLDISKIKNIRDLRKYGNLQVTYVTALSEKPYGLLLLDNFDAVLNVPLIVNFYDIKTNVIHKLTELRQIDDGTLNEFGFRYDAVNFYPSPSMKSFVLGFGFIPNRIDINGNKKGDNIDALCNLNLEVKESEL